VQGVRAPGVFVMDLAAPPQERWAGSLALSMQGRTWIDTWGPIFASHNASLFNRLNSNPPFPVLLLLFLLGPLSHHANTLHAISVRTVSSAEPSITWFVPSY